MKGSEGSFVANSVLIVLLVSSLVSYLLGLLNGFITWFGFFVSFFFGIFRQFYLFPLWFFSIYPKSSLVYLSSVLIPSYSVTPATLFFLISTGLALGLILLGRLFEGTLFIFSAVLIGVIQFILVASVTGFNPSGTSLTILFTDPAGVLPYGVIFFQKNMVPLLASEIFLSVGCGIGLRLNYVHIKDLLGRIKAPNPDYFRILKSASDKISLYGFIPLLIFLILLLSYQLVLQYEFPNYYPFLGLLKGFNEPSAIFFGL